MDSFEYLIALVSVVAGLAITRALSGVARLIDNRKKIVFSWIPICWTVNVLLWLITFWWFTFLLSSSQDWTPGLHLFVLIYAGTIFFLLALLHPESIRDRHDMLEHLLDNRRLFFGTLLALAVVDLADTWIKFQLGLSVPPKIPYGLLVSSWIVLSGIGMYTRSRTYHRIFALTFLVGMGLWQGYALSGVLDTF